MNRIWTPNRRELLRNAAFGAAALTTPGLFAEMLTATAPFTEGPFYPDKLPLDTDNDLLVINDSITPAVGEITHLSGRVLTGPVNQFEMHSLKSGRSTARESICTRAVTTNREQTPTFRDMVVS